MISLPFTYFNEAIAESSLPDRFTFPFYYQAHPVALMAIEQLQHNLLQSDLLKQHFFAEDNGNAGKMFGVLVVKNQQGELGYLSSYSGQLPNDITIGNETLCFVPSIAQGVEKKDFIVDQQTLINDLNKQLNSLMTTLRIDDLENEKRELTQQFENETESFRQQIIAARKTRKEKRAQAKNTLSALETTALFAELAKESVAEKNELNHLKALSQEKIAVVESQLNHAKKQVDNIKEQRKALSIQLQKTIFEQYQFLNALGEVSNVIELFSSPATDESLTQQFQSIPSGAGDCAAPRLLNYAYQHHYQPIAMAEFWWGNSPKSAIRKHQHIYPACHSKCHPILTHMLKGLNVDDNPLLMNPAEGKQLDIIYQDDDILVVNKPDNLLSVPGKNISDSVYSRIKLAFPYATGPLIVHRLDMSTSGLMVLALTKDANKQLQKQFIKRTVTKRYVAVLSAVLADDTGTVNLPLRVDLDDRPRQLVCYEYGKSAETYYEVIQRNENTTRVYFYPKTGRTHQLRVHSAHHLGLNAAIVGDEHYGCSDRRLHLHAEQLTFIHPATHQQVSFEVAPDF